MNHLVWVKADLKRALDKANQIKAMLALPDKAKVTAYQALTKLVADATPLLDDIIKTLSSASSKMDAKVYTITLVSLPEQGELNAKLVKTHTIVVMHADPTQAVALAVRVASESFPKVAKPRRYLPVGIYEGQPVNLVKSAVPEPPQVKLVEQAPKKLKKKG